MTRETYLHTRFKRVVDTHGKGKFILERVESAITWGFPDIVLFYEGKIIPIELKASAGKLEVTQINWWREKVRMHIKGFLLHESKGRKIYLFRGKNILDFNMYTSEADKLAQSCLCVNSFNMTFLKEFEKLL